MPRRFKPTRVANLCRPDFEEDVRKAVRDRQRGMTLRKAAAKHGISKSALQRYCKLKHLTIGKKGGQLALPKHQEEELVKCLVTCAEWGYPLSTFDLRCFVKAFLDKNDLQVPRFRDNFPGYDWAISFLTRHQARLSQRLCQNIKRSRARVSSAVINSFFDELAFTLESIEPHLIINYDESALADDPGRRRLIFKKGCKYPERVMNQSKSSISVMFAATASGLLLPPYVIYKSTNLYDLWTTGGPPGALYNRSKSGWMDSIVFMDWFQNVVIPYCRRFEGNKLLIGDNLSSHLSPSVVKLCEEHSIRFVFLPANSTHLTQPLDVALFRPMKSSWRRVLERSKLKSTAGNQPFDKKQFPSLLSATLKHMENDLERDIKSGFSKCGIHPLNRKRVLAKLPQEDPDSAEDSGSINNSLTEFLREMRYGNQSEPPKGRKKKLHVPPGRSVTLADLQLGSDAENVASENGIEPMDEDNDIPDDTEEPGACDAMSDDAIDGLGKVFAVLDHELIHDEVKSGSLRINSWVKVEFSYGKSKTHCVGQVLRKVGDQDCYVGTFLRQSTRKADVFVFPNIPDEREFYDQNVVTFLETPAVRRGRHTFEQNPMN